METFEEFFSRRINEDEHDGVAPALGRIDGMPDPRAGSPSPGDDAKSAYRDLEPSIQSAIAGPSGQSILSAVVQSIMNDTQVPDRIKTDIQSKISAKWSHLVDTGVRPVKNMGANNIPSPLTGANSARPGMPMANF